MSLRQVMAEQGFDDDGAHPHSWRCENPDRFPHYCTCVNEMIDAILAWMREQGFCRHEPVTTDRGLAPR